MTLPAPYPADTRAKGWRFEIDYEKVEQSDTWALAAEVPMAQHALLLMWVVAWTQVPCGSLPNDESIIRAKCKIPPKMWATLRPVLMRGWWLAEDGRLYHDTIIQRVNEMLAYRAKEAGRKSRTRGRPAVSRGTDEGQTGDSTVSHDTGTGTGTGTIPTNVGSTRNGEACKAMRASGLQGVNPSHPKLAALLDAGVTIAELVDASAEAAKKGKPFAYALATAEGRRRDAVVEPIPTVQADPDSRSAIEAEGVAKGIGKWNEIHEQWHAYKARVRGRTPSLDLNALAGMAADRAGAH